MTCPIIFDRSKKNIVLISSQLSLIYDFNVDFVTPQSHNHFLIRKVAYKTNQLSNHQPHLKINQMCLYIATMDA